MKSEYKSYTGTDFPAPNKTPSKSKEAKPAQKEKIVKQKPAAKEKKPVDVKVNQVLFRFLIFIYLSFEGRGRWIEKTNQIRFGI